MTTTRSDQHVSPQHTVPTHLKTPDKILFGLTARQLLVLLTGGSLAYALWLQWERIALSWGLMPPWSLVLASLGVLPLVMLTLSTTFIQIADRPLELWLIVWLRTRTAPRSYVWRASKWEPTEKELPVDLDDLGLSWMQEADEEQQESPDHASSTSSSHLDDEISWQFFDEEGEEVDVDLAALSHLDDEVTLLPPSWPPLDEEYEEEGEDSLADPKHAALKQPGRIHTQRHTTTMPGWMHMPEQEPYP
ncbi:PrgI family protein [Ktedonospora formicarum]|uniref:PrgI family protein n=1 Tax=Ktedonospora formicarum TaxID=2778364 RepID=A0A8J3MWF6_9CHLR|nr:PrgI family protein [Ktedonospora formicarum]GHO48598.1 hypothetical protein KSX_67610 [Ktedonospora formicarum]